MRGEILRKNKLPKITHIVCAGIRAKLLLMMPWSTPFIDHSAWPVWAHCSSLWFWGVCSSLPLAVGACGVYFPQVEKAVFPPGLHLPPSWSLTLLLSAYERQFLPPIPTELQI